MPSFIRHPQDFWTGIIFLFFGIGTVVIGQDYGIGSAGRMGPAYFPIVLGALLTLIGTAGVVRSAFRRGEPVGRFHIRELALVLGAVLLFGFLLRGAGLVAATIVIVLVSGYAGATFKLGKALALALGLALFAVLLFAILLGLPLAIVGPWLGAH